MPCTCTAVHWCTYCLAIIHRLNRREVEVALAVHDEGEAQGGARITLGVEVDLVSGERVFGVFAEAAACHLAVLQLHGIGVGEQVDFLSLNRRASSLVSV